MPSKLIELEIPRPGIFGVNTSASGDIMPKEYAVDVNNLVISDEGYPEARRGSKRLHADTLNTTLTAGSAQTVRSIYHTRDESGDDLTIFSTEGYICKISGPSITDITGTITTPTAGNWKFVNLNDTIIGFQPGHKIIESTTPSSTSFNDVTFTATGSETPAGDGATSAVDILAAAGRLWVLDDDQLRYSSLLDHTDFSTSTDSPAGDAGAFDLNASMLGGDAKPIAITEFNGNILVMYENFITVYGGIWNPNGDSSNPEPAMTLVENIAGVGCIARDSIQKTQNDVVFLSDQGVTSLSRVVQEKSMPLRRYSDNVRKELNELVKTASLDKVWSVYLEGKGVYLLGASDYSNTILIDVKAPLPDESYRCLLWNKSFYTMAARPSRLLTATEDTWAALLVSDEADYISYMTGYKDYVASGGTGGSSYDVSFTSAWTAILDELANRIKFPKKVHITVKGGLGQTFTMNMTYDYGEFVAGNAQTAQTASGNPSRYNVNTYYNGTSASSTTGYYSKVISFEQAKVTGKSGGRILKIKFISTVDGSPLSLQRISILAKLGRQQ